MTKETLRHSDRYGFVGVRLVKGQIELLDKCVTLTGQTRTDLVREALARFLPDLHSQLKDRGES